MWYFVLMNDFEYSEQLKRSTLVSEEGLRFLAGLEGVDPNLVCSIAPRWAESAPRSEDVESALVRCDLILRSDGSAVFLDGVMGGDSRELAAQHLEGQTNPNGLPWVEWTASVTELPKPLK